MYTSTPCSLCKLLLLLSINVVPRQFWGEIHVFLVHFNVSDVMTYMYPFHNNHSDVDLPRVPILYVLTPFSQYTRYIPLTRGFLLADVVHVTVEMTPYPEGGGGGGFSVRPTHFFFSDQPTPTTHLPTLWPQAAPFCPAHRAAPKSSNGHGSVPEWKL